MQFMTVSVELECIILNGLPWRKSAFSECF